MLLNFIWNFLERILDLVNTAQFHFEFPSRIFDLVKVAYQSDPMHVGLLWGILLFAMPDNKWDGQFQSLQGTTTQLQVEGRPYTTVCDSC
jgi:hypothetical protein